MTTSTQTGIRAPNFGRWIDERGQPTQEFWRAFELICYRVAKIDEAARTYTAITPGTATAAQIATALNTFMEDATET